MKQNDMKRRIHFGDLWLGYKDTPVVLNLLAARKRELGRTRKGDPTITLGRNVYIYHGTKYRQKFDT